MSETTAVGHRKLLWIWALIAAALTVSPLVAQNEGEEQFEKNSLAYRTSLHYDPLLKPQLEALVELYRSNGRADELVGLYQGHIGQYPDDAGAKAVLVRILKKLELPIDQQIAAASQQHPNSAALQYLFFQYLDQNSDSRAVAVLSRAIELQTNASRKTEWLDELLQRADEESARDLAAGHLKQILAIEDQTPQSFLSLASLMQRYRYWDLSLSALAKAKSAHPDPETGIEIEILSAKAEAALGNRKSAGERLDKVLSKLSADHWRRSEVMSLRISVFATDEERETMLATAKKTFEEHSNKESAVLDYAELLAASGRRESAQEVLIDGSLALPQSQVLETRALAILDESEDLKSAEQFLSEKLEASPDRADLRFRYVKALFANNKGLDARQELETVLAGEDSEKGSARLLELARYLQGIEKLKPAASILRTFVKKNPNRHDVIRELAEIYLDFDDETGINSLLSEVDATSGETANFLDLATFLVDNNFFIPARRLLSERFDADKQQFETGLILIEVLSEMGDLKATEDRIEQVRKLADASPRYAKWLEVSLSANARFERAATFFDTEESRFAYAGDEWTQERIERFLILVEKAGATNLSDQVSRAIRSQLTRPRIEKDLKIRLRRLLVSSLADNIENATEVEEQLTLLQQEDPEHVDEYRLRLATIYHAAERHDLAQATLDSVRLDNVSDAELLQDALSIAIEYEFLERAELILAAINRTNPSDVFSWEKRLTLLAATGRERDFRTVVRTLLQEVNLLNLKESSRSELRGRLVDSYWRAIARILSDTGSTEMQEILPILESVERETPDTDDRLWAEWARALVMQSAGQSEEARKIVETIRANFGAKEQHIVFPDGLSLSVGAAIDILESAGTSGEKTGIASGNPAILDQPELGWAFEVDPGARILSIVSAEDSVIVLDNRGQVYRVELATGKLIWKEPLGLSFAPAYVRVKQTSPPFSIPRFAAARQVRLLDSGAERFILLFGEEIRAYRVQDCQLIWKAGPDSVDLPEVSTLAGAVPDPCLTTGEGKVIRFHPLTSVVSAFESATGKLLWTRSIADPDNLSENSDPVSLNSGVIIGNGTVFAYGRDSALLDAETGEIRWTFSDAHVSAFPVTIRERREGESDNIPEEPDTTVEVAEWQGGDSLDAGQNQSLLLDYLKSNPDPAATIQSLDSFGRPTRLVAPSVKWAESRLRKATPAMARIVDGQLWLMGEEGLRRISLSLPVASQEFEVSGALLGIVGNHAWFASDSGLQHVDFFDGLVTEHSTSDLGPARNLRGLLEGNLLYVRGNAGIAIWNALTGRKIGQWNWPASLITYLKDGSFEPATDVHQGLIWQGRVLSAGAGQPEYCYPIQDVIAGGGYLTVFDRKSLAFFAGRKSTEQAAPVKPVEPEPANGKQ